MTRSFAIASVLLAAGATSLVGQFRGGPEWTTGGGDAQRTHWVRTDPKISKDTVGKGFAVAWKVKLANPPRQENALFAPVMLDRYIGYRGFRSFAFIAGSSNNVFAIDTDLGRIEWQKHFPLTVPAGNAACPGGITASFVELTSPAIASGDGRGGRGRGGPAKSGVGAPLEGAVTISEVRPAPNVPSGGRGPAAGRAGVPGPGRGRMPSMIYGVSSDGAFHSMYVSNGEEPQPPLKFLPPNANVKDVALIEGTAYAVTTGNCGGAPNGVWALDTESKNVASWKGNAVGIAFGPDGEVYAATGDGQIVALEAKTLNKKASYSAGQALISAPTVFESNGKIMVAAAAKDGSLHVVDAASMTGSSAKSATPVDSLATWVDGGGTRWIAGSSSQGITAWKLTGSLQPGWSSPAIASAVGPIVVNGVLFTAAAGNRSSHAVLYALDAETGRELWNSGSLIPSYIPRSGALSSSGSQLYFGTYDGTFWEFGFPIEH
ncbi:MAG: PQQ-binding-like beta-propeller repeat protein [Acidobacteriota bacterium]|nr:PQQ-binding-like beta-propeller repeat protein [Acidobacteriota bacterium]